MFFLAIIVEAVGMNRIILRSKAWQTVIVWGSKHSGMQD